MSSIILNTERLKYNYDYLSRLFEAKEIDWAIVSKVLCGNRRFLRALLALGHHQYCDSRLLNLKAVKNIDPNIKTIFIKPPARRYISTLVSCADISLNTTVDTVKLISEEAVRQDKKHQIIIMVELGELREGVIPEKLLSFYERVYQLPHIEVVGIGANMACLNGVLPSEENMRRLVELKHQIEKKYQTTLPYISGGASVTIPLIMKDEIPKEVNHFRVGDTLFFGSNVYSDSYIEGMKKDVFEVKAQILELKEKPIVPTGELGTNLMGRQVSFNEEDEDQTSNRAIIDIGVLDVEASHLYPKDPTLTISGASSDMTIVDLGDNPNGYKVGDYLYFNTNYMGALRLMSSSYIRKELR